MAADIEYVLQGLNENIYNSRIVSLDQEPIFSSTRQQRESIVSFEIA